MIFVGKLRVSTQKSFDIVKKKKKREIGVGRGNFK